MFAVRNRIKNLVNMLDNVKIYYICNQVFYFCFHLSEF